MIPEIGHFALILALAFGLTGLALLAATFLQVKVALRPLSVIEKGLSDIRTGAAARLDGDFPAEIEPLQVELNALMESNEDIIDRARMAARANTIGRVTPVLPVVEGLQRALERIHLDKGVRITLACDDGLTFRGEKQDLEELLGNLLDNASKWSKGHVRLLGKFIETDRAHTGHWLQVTIEDDGPGVPEAQRAAMVKRGRRLDESKPGSGLGLSIVHDLVTSYRGELQLSRSELGGLKAELTLPAVKP